MSRPHCLPLTGLEPSPAPTPAAPPASAPGSARALPRSPTPPHSPRRTRSAAWLLPALGLLAFGPAATAGDTTPAQQLERFAAQAGTAGQAERGRVFFGSRHGGEWSCATCHGQPPTQPGRHVVTQKALEPLAPAANPAALTDSARVDKWLRRNCKDVLQRECSAGEKADVLAYLLALPR